MSSAGKRDPEETRGVAQQERIRPTCEQRPYSQNELHRFKDLKTKRFGSDSSCSYMCVCYV